MKQYIQGREYDFKNGTVYKDGNKLGKKKRDQIIYNKWALDLATEAMKKQLEKSLFRNFLGDSKDRIIIPRSFSFSWGVNAIPLPTSPIAIARVAV